MEEAKVSGALIFILRISRIIGLSPVTFTHFNDEYYLTLSNTAALYGYFIIISINLLALIAFILDITVYNRFPIARFINILSLIMMSGLFCYNTRARAKTMVTHIASLNKIKDNQSYLKDKSQSLDKRLLILCLGTWTFGIFSIAITFIRNIFSAQNLSHYLYLSVTLQRVQVMTYELQTIILQLKIYEVMKSLTGELRNHLDLIKSDQPTAVSTKMCILNIANAYVSICKVVHQMNEREGKIIFCLIAKHIFFTLYCSCRFINSITNNKTSLYQLLWVLMFLMRLYLIIEPCHYISKEPLKIHVLLSKLVSHTTETGQPFEWEWELIFKQLSLVLPTFTPLGMLTLNRAFLITVVSVLTTYLGMFFPYIKSFFSNKIFY